jgi:c-di-GMP-binding flagellar brake protein YcgR
MANRGREIKNNFGVAEIEERKHPRLLLNLPVEYYLAESDIQGTGHTGNASEGGLILYLRKHFRVGDLLKLKLFFSSGVGMNSVELLSQVMWTEKLENKEYRCGLKFVGISPKDMENFNSFLKDFTAISH